MGGGAHDFVHLRRLRRMRGGSQSHLLRAADGASYVTKFQNNEPRTRPRQRDAGHQVRREIRASNAAR